MTAPLAEAVLVDGEQHTQADWMYEVRMGPEKAAEVDLQEGRSRNEHELTLVRLVGRANIWNWRMAQGEVRASIEHWQVLLKEALESILTTAEEPPAGQVSCLFWSAQRAARGTWVTVQAVGTELCQGQCPSLVRLHCAVLTMKALAL